MSPAPTLLPPHATPLERALEAATARLDALPVPFRDLWSPARCPLAFLPWLAWALGVEAWDSAWPEPVRRAAVAEALAIHRAKGTLPALRRLLDALGAVYDLEEWPGGAAMTLAITIHNGDALPLQGLAGLNAAIDRVKRIAVQHTLTLRAGLSGEVAVAGGLGGLAVAAAAVEIG